uniref:hypothetical protein n=1 Tax=Eubacterium cellulosolvens TaxID=29322 RepID=UPI0012DD793E|nr:hypothetical protein [[Eubacterium] cellulosolvens]
MKRKRILAILFFCATAINMSSCGKTVAETSTSSEKITTASSVCTLPPTVTPALETTSTQEVTSTPEETEMPTPTPVPKETETVAEPEEQNEALASETRILTEEQAYEAVINHNRITGSGNAGEHNTVGAVEYWNTSTNEDGIIVVLYRSFTGAVIRYYVNPVTGETYVTEWVYGIVDEETRTGETFNAWDYFVS